ncbi:MAG: ABC transporter substrate-binding protein [Planctomycetota bacterium]
MRADHRTPPSRPRRPRRALALALAATLLLGLPACGGDDADGDGGAGGAGKTPPGVVLEDGRGKDSIKLDPAQASDGESSKVIDNVYETLVDFSWDPATPTAIVPRLATSWKESEDRRSWTFELRPGVVFHDGTPFDSAAVVATFEHLLAKDAGERPYRGNFLDVEAVEASGPGRVVFRLKEPSAVLLRNLAMFCASIVSPKALKKHGEALASHPVGTGPFKLLRWQKDQVVVLQRFERWWGKERGNLDVVVFKQIKDWASRREQLKSGEIQMTDDLVFQDVDELRATPGVEVQITDGMNVCYLTMNREKAPFDDARTRKAVAMAIDRDRIVELGYYGQAVPARDMLPPNIPFHTGTVAPAHDPQAAEDLFVASGARGLEVELCVMNNPRPYLMQPDLVGQIIKDSLAKAGLEVRIVKLDWATYLARLQRGEYQMAIIGWSTDNGDPDNFYTPLLSSGSIDGTNYSRFSDTNFDVLLAEARQVTDEARRGELFARMQAILAEDCPTVPLVHTRIGSAFRDDVTGFIRHPIKIRLERTSRTTPR